MAVDLVDWAPRAGRAFDGLPSVVRRAMGRSLGDAVAHARRLAGHPRVASAISSSQTDGRLSITSAHPGAASRETGDRLRGSPYLAVPLRPAVRAIGGPRQDARLFVLRLADGRLFLARRAGRSLDVRWRLVDSVLPLHRPAVLPAGRAMIDALPGDLAGAMSEALT